MNRRRHSICRLGFAVALACACTAAAQLGCNQYGESRGGQAEDEIRCIATAVATYYSQIHQYPKTLRELTEPISDFNGMALIEPSILVDPWGNPYQYDPHQIDPVSKKPLIWSKGSPQRDSPIKNWDIW